MRAPHDLSQVTTAFDESDLVPTAELLPAALAQRIDLDVRGQLDRRRIELPTITSLGTATVPVRCTPG